MNRFLKLGFLLIIMIFMVGCFGIDEEEKTDEKKEPKTNESGLVARMPLHPSATLFKEETEVIGPIDAFIYETEISVTDLYDWYIEELDKSEVYTEVIVYGVSPNYFTIEAIFEDDGVEYKDGIQVTDLADKIVENVQIRFVTANPLK